MTDFELLQEYAKRNSDEAFGGLVDRYTGLVYSAALRQTDNAGSAEEITQAVFIILARKARGFRSGVVLSGWLLRTPRFVALNARRQELRRRDLEQEAVSLHSYDAGFAWKRIEPLLDDALFSLSERERSAIALRFFEEKSFKEIALTLGTTEDNAQKRVSRALEKLRFRFKRRGIVLSAALVSGAINGRAVQPAPAELQAAVRRTALLGLAGKSLSFALAKLTLKTLLAAQIRRLAVRGITVLFIVATIALLSFYLNRSGQVRTAAVRPVAETNLQSNALLAPGVINALPAQPTNGQQLRFRVVDAETGARVSKTRVTLVWTPDVATHMTNVTTTDRQGTALLAVDRVAGKDWSYRIEVFRDGFIPKYVSWSERQGDDPKDIPSEYTTKLYPAANVGGIVVNESGMPIPEARVVFDVHKYGAPAESLDRERLTMTTYYHVEMTDSQGRWHCSHVPPEFGMIHFTVAHPEYAPGRFGCAVLGATTNHGEPFLPQADFKNETAVMSLVHGAVAAGIVVDEAGTPVAGAKVTLDQRWGEPTASQLTGPDGRFRFSNIAHETEPARQNEICFLTVQAEGYAPEDTTFHSAVPPTESRLTLTRGVELHGRVVDDNGEPVPKALVQICSHSNVKRFEWRTFTDAQGRFEWTSAPPKPEFYVIAASGYQAMREIKLAPDGTGHPITLHTNPGPILIFGTALDATTEKPLDHFEVWMSFIEKIYTGYSEPMDSPRPARLRAIGENGRFWFTNNDPFVGYTLEVRADGYCPVEKNGRGSLTNDSNFQFRLERGSPVQGTVCLADGAPVAGAIVMLVARHKGVYMKLPGQFDLTLSGASHVETDAQGRFAFPPTKDAKNILASSPEGFASITPKELSSSPKVTLQPWGCVMGILKVGNQSAAHETVDLSYIPPMGEPVDYSLFLETTTDDQGRFSFQGVPPWDLQIAHRLSFHQSSPMGIIPQNLQTQIKVVAGQTNFVALGGTGRQVIGSIKLPGNETERQVDWQLDVQTLTTKPAGLPEPPQREALGSQGEFQAASKKWFEDQSAFWKSEAGREAQRNQKRYVLVFDKNGSFKIDDVVAGNYELKIRLSDPAKPIPRSFVPLYEPIGTLTKEITIPEATSQELGSIDLGVLELHEQ
jgi:RNA polymerase sigma factor (sigma-70 family)